jgi:hypothetical protein
MSEAPATPPARKDTWDKAHIVMQPVGGLLTGIAIVWIGFITNKHLSQRQEVDAKERLYSELMSRREDSESALRKDMFGSIITSFLSNQRPQTPTPAEELEDKVLNLELLSYNFHESLNLSPLFLHLGRSIAEAKIKPAERFQFRDRLNRVAAEINRREGDLLESAGESTEWDVDLDSIPTGEGPSYQIGEATLKVDGFTRVFQLTALGKDIDRQELQVRLQVIGPDTTAEHKETQAVFAVGFYDFPMVDNTRLSNDQRCAVTLLSMEGSHARVRLLYFPGSRASLRERPYYEEILENLHRGDSSQ